MLSMLKDLFKLEDRPQPRFEPAPAPQKPEESVLERMDIRALEDEMKKAKDAYKKRSAKALAKVTAETPEGRVIERPEGGFIIQRSSIYNSDTDLLGFASVFGRFYRDPWETPAGARKRLIREIGYENERKPYHSARWKTYQKAAGVHVSARASSSGYGYSSANVGPETHYEDVVFTTRALAEKGLEKWLRPEGVTTEYRLSKVTPKREKEEVK